MFAVTDCLSGHVLWPSFSGAALRGDGGLELRVAGSGDGARLSLYPKGVDHGANPVRQERLLALGRRCGGGPGDGQPHRQHRGRSRARRVPRGRRQHDRGRRLRELSRVKSQPRDSNPPSPGYRPGAAPSLLGWRRSLLSVAPAGVEPATSRLEGERSSDRASGPDPGDGLEPPRRWVRARSSSPENPGPIEQQGQAKRANNCLALGLFQLRVGTECRRLVRFGARPEIRTPMEPGLSRPPLPVGPGARDAYRGRGWRERELNPRRSACRAVLRPDGLPGRNGQTWFVRAGGVEPLVGRLSCGCTSVVLRARSFSCQGQDLHLQHTGSEPASSAGWDTLASLRSGRESNSPWAVDSRLASQMRTGPDVSPRGDSNSQRCLRRAAPIRPAGRSSRRCTRGRIRTCGETVNSRPRCQLRHPGKRTCRPGPHLGASPGPRTSFRVPPGKSNPARRLEDRVLAARTAVRNGAPRRTCTGM